MLCFRYANIDHWPAFQLQHQPCTAMFKREGRWNSKGMHFLDWAKSSRTEYMCAWAQLLPQKYHGQVRRNWPRPPFQVVIHQTFIKLTGFWSQPCLDPGLGPFCENTLSCIADFSLFMRHTAPQLLLLGSSYLWEQMFCAIRIKESQVRLQKTKHPLSGSSRISELTFKEKVRGKEGQQTGHDKRWKCHFNSYGSGGFHCKGLKGAGFSTLGQES